MLMWHLSIWLTIDVLLEEVWINSSLFFSFSFCLHPWSKTALESRLVLSCDSFWSLAASLTCHSNNCQTKSERYSPLQTLKGLDGKKEVMIETCRRDFEQRRYRMWKSRLGERAREWSRRYEELKNLWCSSHFRLKDILGIITCKLYPNLTERQTTFIFSQV